MAILPCVGPRGRGRVGLVGGVLFVLGFLSIGAAVFLPVLGALVVVVLLAGIFVILGAGLFASRRHEEEADDYAAAYQGNLRGADELFQWLAARRAKAQAAGAMSRADGNASTPARPAGAAGQEAKRFDPGWSCLRRIQDLEPLFAPPWPHETKRQCRRDKNVNL